MTITVVEPRTAAQPGYGRAYASVPVQISRQGVLRPASLAQWRPFVPGTDDQYTGPLFGDAYSETPLSFPQRADERGLIQVWAPEPVRIEVGAWSDGYASVRHVLDLLFTEDFSQAEADGLYAPLAHTTAPDQHPEYLTTTEGDLRYQTLPLPPPVIPGEYLTQTEADDLYLPLSYVPPASGISQADADLRYVNTAGPETKTGALTISGGLEVTQYLYAYGGFVQVSGPGYASVQASAPAGTARDLVLQTAGFPRWSLLATPTAETGSNAGSDFRIDRYDDAGGYLGAALTLTRATGAATFGGAVTVNSPTTTALTLNPAAGQRAVQFGAGGYVEPDPAGNGGSLLLASGSYLFLDSGGNSVAPWRTNAIALGSSSSRYSTVYTGAIDATGAATFGGAVTVEQYVISPALYARNTVSGGDLFLDGPAGSSRTVTWSTNATSRWGLTVNTDPETGSNAGSNWELNRFSDAEAYLGAALGFNRATGQATFGGPVTANGLVRVNRPALGDAFLETYVGAEANPRVRITGNKVWFGIGSGVPEAGISRVASNTLGPDGNWAPASTNGYDLGVSALRWRNLLLGTSATIGTANTAAAGALRLPNAAVVGWRNAANTADLTLSMDASDRLALAVGAGSLTTSATAGGATALPATPSTYITVVVNGQTLKLPAYAV